MRYAYQRGGAPLLDWTRGPPRQSRAADSVALGSLGGSTLSGPTIVLPRPGAPEVINGAGVGPGAPPAWRASAAALSGCACSGSCGCGPTAGMSGLVDAVPGGYLTLGALVCVGWWLAGKRKR